MQISSHCINALTNMLRERGSLVDCTATWLSRVSVVLRYHTLPLIVQGARATVSPGNAN